SWPHASAIFANSDSRGWNLESSRLVSSSRASRSRCDSDNRNGSGADGSVALRLNSPPSHGRHRLPSTATDANASLSCKPSANIQGEAHTQKSRRNLSRKFPEGQKEERSTQLIPDQRWPVLSLASGWSRSILAGETTLRD